MICLPAELNHVSPLIIDIYQRAATAYRSLQDMDNSNNVCLAHLLQPFVEEFNKLPDEIQNTISTCNKFSICEELDNVFFNTGSTGYWRESFKNPYIGQILTNEEFGSDHLPSHGFRVDSHGLLTMRLEYVDSNDQNDQNDSWGPSDDEWEEKADNAKLDMQEYLRSRR